MSAACVVAESTSASAERAATREIFMLRERRNVVLTGDAPVEIVVEVCDLQSSLRPKPGRPALQYFNRNL